MKIENMKNIDNLLSGQFKLDSMKDIKDFLKGFKSIAEAKMAIAAIIDEVRKVNPELAGKLEKVIQALDKAEKSGMTMDDFLKNIEKLMVNENAATQGISLFQQAQHTFTDNASTNTTTKVNGTSSIA